MQATQGSTTTESYSYDPVGNRLSSLGVSSYTVNSSNELTATSNASGYKFLVFNPTPGKSSFEMTVVEQSDRDGAANFFIHRVPISKFFNESSRKKFGVATSEGILLADAGAKEYETDVYFWANGSYQHQPVDY